ncbi:MAG TPA: hypothetical protein ENI64_03875, partial [Gammaproteobacteria bacterium]|nr:hypothetical protein [Gammaproteobacteria bacterium]
MKSVIAVRIVGLFVACVLTACGGGNSGSSDNTSSSGNLQAAGEDFQISGAGIKGPLAFADTKVFALDTSFPDFYDKSSPISSVVTNQSAQIIGLSVPRNIAPPYVLTIGGANAVDLNTGKAPVISTLVTVITKEMLADGQPIYATPLTKLAFNMARYSSGPSTDSRTFVQKLQNSSSQVGRLFAIDQKVGIDIFKSPLIINEDTTTVAQQNEALHHRAALEAFAAKVNEMTNPKGDGLRARYYNDRSLSNIALERVDANVNFDWQRGAPAGTIAPETFSVRWTGLIEPAYSENYTFYSSTDDGVRLWIDGQLVIDQWTDQSVTEYAGTINLTAGNKYPIVMEYYENTGDAVAKLYWSSTSLPKTIVATKSLYSVSDPSLLANVTTDSIIDRLALDIESDGIIDNLADGTTVGGIDPAILNQNSKDLMIPNTGYRVQEIARLMEDERILIGTDKGPDLLVDTIDFSDPPDVVTPDPVVPDPVVPDPVVPDPVVPDPVV